MCWSCHTQCNANRNTMHCKSHNIKRVLLKCKIPVEQVQMNVLKIRLLSSEKSVNSPNNLLLLLLLLVVAVVVVVVLVARQQQQQQWLHWSMYAFPNHAYVVWLQLFFDCFICGYVQLTLYSMMLRSKYKSCSKQLLFSMWQKLKEKSQNIKCSSFIPPKYHYISAQFSSL